jgi:hypothetical protein
MKRLFVLFFFLFITIVYSQEKIRIGISTGANNYSLRGSEILDDVDSNFGYSIGLSFEYKFSKKFSLSTDLMIEKKQVSYFYEFDFQGFNPDGSNAESIHYNAVTKNNFNYLTLPIALKYSIGDNNPYFIKTGVFLAKILFQNDKTEVSPTWTYYNNTNGENFPMDSSIDYGLTFALGKEFKLKDKNYLSLELRDNLGFYNSISGQGDESQEIKSNTISFLIQWSIGL